MTKYRTVNIYAELVSSSPERYKFSMEEGGLKTNELVFNKSKDGLSPSERYHIKFKLHNRNNSKLHFSKIPEKVMWAAKLDSPDDPCPNHDVYMYGDFFVDTTTTIKDKELMVINEDRYDEWFAFAFNFVRDGENEGDGSTYNYVRYDPVGNNQNGGDRFAAFDRLTVGLLAGGALAAGLALGALVIAPALR